MLAICAAPGEVRAQSAEARAVLQVCGRGPEATTARALRGSGAAEISASEVLPNPSLVLQHQQTLDGPEERETVIGLSIPLGLGGRRFIRQDAAEARRAASDASGDALLVSIAIDVQEALAAAALDERRARVLTERQAALDALDTLLEGLTRGGETARHDRSRQRIQARLHRTDLEEAQARAASSAELVAAWLGAPAGAAVEPSLLSPATAHPSAGSWKAGAQAPHLLALEAEARAQGLDADAADRGWVPDVDVFAGYRNVDAGGAIGHGLSIGLTVPLTAFDRGQGDAARASAAEAVTRARLAAERARIGRVERAATAHLARLLATASDVEAAERDAAEGAQAARDLYSAGESTLTELFGAYEAHEDAQLAWLDRLERIAAARVELMRVRGSLMDPALERGCLDAARGDKR